MTPTELITYVRNIHNAISDDHWSDEEILALAQAKTNEILSIIGLIENTTASTSTASTQTLAWPTNAVFIRRVRYENEPLQLVSFRQWESDLRSDTLRTGRPRGYALWGRNIYFTPIPDTTGDTIDIFHEDNEGTLTTNSTLGLDPSLHGRLAEGMIAQMYAKDENSGMYDRYQGRWEGIHAQAFREYKSQRKRSGSAMVTTDVDGVLIRDFGTP